MKKNNQAVEISPIMDITAPATEQATVIAPAPYIIAPMTAKNLVKVSAIATDAASLSISQNGTMLFTRTVEGLSISESFAALSNIFHYYFKGKKVRFDKYNALHITLTFGDKVYTSVKPAHTNKKGEYVPFTSGSVGGLLKVLYHNFAADVMVSVTMQGVYLNFVHAANTIANFAPVRPVSVTSK